METNPIFIETNQTFSLWMENVNKLLVHYVHGTSDDFIEYCDVDYAALYNDNLSPYDAFHCALCDYGFDTNDITF
jgi:hypothetical protein